MWPIARWPAQRAEVALVEDLRDQAHVLVDQDLRAVADRDAGRLLAAVLQRVEAEVGELGDLGGRPGPPRPDAEDAAGVLRALLLGMEIVTEPTVAAWHGAESRGGTVRPAGLAGPLRLGGRSVVPLRPVRGRLSRLRLRRVALEEHRDQPAEQRANTRQQSTEVERQLGGVVHVAAANRQHDDGHQQAGGGAGQQEAQVAGPGAGARCRR